MQKTTRVPHPPSANILMDQIVIDTFIISVLSSDVKFKANDNVMQKVTLTSQFHKVS